MNELNLIPYELKAKRKKIKNVIELSFFAGVILIVFTFIALVPRIYLTILEKDEKKITEKIAADQYILKDNAKLLTESNSYKVYYDKVDTMNKEKIFIAEKIKGIDKSIPKDIILSDLAFSNGVLTITGDTENYTSIATCVANLQLTKDYKLSRIEKVDNTTVEGSKTVTESSGYNFIITIHF